MSRTAEAYGRLTPNVQGALWMVASALGFPSAALFAQVPHESNRYVFALPHPDGTLHVGLTDDPIDDRPDVPVPAADEVRFLLETLSPLLSRPLSTDDVIGGFSGLRPLVAGTDPSRRTADLSRRHLVHPEGL